MGERDTYTQRERRAYEREWGEHMKEREESIWKRESVNGQNPKL